MLLQGARRTPAHLRASQQPQDTVPVRLSPDCEDAMTDDDDPLPDLLPPVPDRAFWMAEPEEQP